MSREIPNEQSDSLWSSQIAQEKRRSSNMILRTVIFTLPNSKSEYIHWQEDRSTGSKLEKQENISMTLEGFTSMMQDFIYLITALKRIGLELRWITPTGFHNQN